MARFAFFVLVLFSFNALAEECLYSVSKYSMEFTSYKYTKRAGVKGTFKKIEAKFPKEAKSLEALLSGASFVIDSTSLDTKNPDRNDNIVKNFFKVFTGGTEITGQASRVQKGKLLLRLSAGAKKGSVPMTYSLSKSGVLTAKGTFDILKFGLKGPFQSIQKACRDLHKGKDGVSKTWSDVDLRVTVNIKQNCSK